MASVGASRRGTCPGRHSDRRLTGTSGRHLAGAPIEDGLAPPLAVGQSDGGNGGTLRTRRCGRPPRRALVRPSEAAPSSSDRAAYRLDYFEIDPRHRRGSLGLFAFALAGSRAMELGAQYLILGAFPPVATFYERAGGARGAVQGWNAARGLIPFRFTREALTRLEDIAGGFAVGTEEA